MFSLFLVVCILGSALSADILAVFPHPGKTHFDVFEPLVLALAARGHHLTVLSFFPQRMPVTNVTDISLEGTMPVFINAVPFELVRGHANTPFTNYMWTIDIGHESCQNVLRSEQVKTLLKSKKKFDLIIFEIFNADCFYSFADIFKVPFMGFSSCQAFPHHNLRVANPDNFHISSTVFYPMSRYMNFLERLKNTVGTLGMQLLWIYHYAVRDQRLVEEVIGKDISLREVTSRISLILVNSHYSLQGPRPTVPAFIEVGGLNILPAKPLSKILAVFPHPGKSHVDVFEPLVLALAARGHHLTVLSFFPQRTPVTNVTDISLVGVVPLFVEGIKFEEIFDKEPVDNFIWAYEYSLQICEKVMSSQQVKQLLKSNKKFDLIIFEIFGTDCVFSFAKIFKSPFISFSSCTPLPHHGGRVGNPDNLLVSSNVFFPMSKHMNLYEKIVNTVSTIAMKTVWYYWHISEEQTVVNKLLDIDISIFDTVKDASLMLVNTHHSIQGPRPLVPAMVEVGGLHISLAKHLSKELDQFLNEAPEGVLLFSMGSVLQSSSFPEDKRQAFMDAFAELKPLRVLMKWENDTLPGKPDNVRLSRWLPQRDVLAHKKVRAFMGHGGLLSTSEAVYEGVPMVLIPMFGDQPNNVAHLVSTGAAVRLGYHDISQDNVLTSLKAVLLDPSYKENAKLLSERYRDRPMSPLDTAVYWTEYVIRHKGAPHLRSAAVDMPWYQLWLLDVIGALLLALAVSLYVIIWVARRVTRIVKNTVFSSTDSKVHKKRD